ncbi:hypothetical protein QUF90_05205 [Desulfococcaceae bacterium HSG9]|nr:hypothetical protein [Desulfococcaceae bacterium HSG9]
MPSFQFFIAADVITPVTPNDAIWQTCLPCNRNQADNSPDDAVTYCEYFEAIRLFLKKNSFRNLLAPIATQYSSVMPDDINAIRIIQEKHGAFYHPARLEVDIKTQCYRFALNVAISDAGLNSINQEYAALRYLNLTFPFHFLPEVYLKGKIAVNNGKKSIGIVMAEWLDGYDEFHLSHKPNGKSGIVVWDQKQGAWFLPEDRILELYTKAAEILTCYYNIDTFEQIFPWHHGAGDFILKAGHDDRLTVKLITVRQYTAMLDFDDGNQKSDEIQMEALLLFLLNLSIRMRLDRIDGVGDIAWANDTAVEGVLKGFFSGLALKSVVNQVTDSFILQFHKYLASQTESDLYESAIAIISAYHPQVPDIPVIQRNLDSHIRVLYKSVSCGGR